MPQITVTTTIQTVYNVDDGVSIERVRHLALPELSDSEEQTSGVLCVHDRALSQIYYGTQDCLRQSVEHAITES